MTLDLLTEKLLIDNNIKIQDLYLLLEKLSERHLDYGDLYFQSNFSESLILEDRIIKNGFHYLDQGVGVRANKQDKTGFASTNQINLNTLVQLINTAKNIINEKNKNKICKLNSVKTHKLYEPINPLNSLMQKEKIALLQRIDKIAYETDQRVEKVNAVLSASYEEVLIATTDGTLAADIRPLVNLSITILVEKDGKREYGTSGGGSRTGYDFFLANENGETRIDKWTKEAVRMALINLSAIEAFAGNIPVVLGPGWPAILLHEAVGHGLEGDFNRRETSVFTNKIGDLIASKLCTVVDNGTLNNLRGSLSIDDEGTPTKCNVLIENGILKSYMNDKLNARLMGKQTTGNGRRESYAHIPMPRMTNTYMLPGQSTPKEIIESVEFGLYAPHFSNGQVDITSGTFVFSTSEAYLIQKGKITKPVKDATLIGSGSKVMKKISMVGNDLILDRGVGTCGKDGQTVPVCVGQPTLKLEKITVGGTRYNKKTT